ncbi:MAG: methyltransferase domain-containing protein [Candidatus Eremiobacteraeota bacterium]|nr:methyltransferase domain-containing protein [Candidatus Eremiobacteraeota bacterium]
MIDTDESIVDPLAIEPAEELPESAPQKMLRRFSRGNAVAPRVARLLASGTVSLAGTRRPLVLVIGGGTIGSGLEEFYADPRIDIVAFDVFPSRFTQFVADGHAIPLADESVDGVVVQAVLEHVLDPARVVADIYRVLRPDGLVYADTPFLQHVHEGPFDFTRFTESGHRWLFRRFALLESGFVAGIGTELTWSVAHAARSVVPLRGVSSAVRLAMTPLAMLIDRFAKPRHAIDGASSVYFYGRRSTEAMRPRDIVGHYRGAQTIPSRTT